MKGFLSIKYYEDMRNKKDIEMICSTLESFSVKTFVFVRDIQNYQKCTFSPTQIMERAFKEIKSSNLIVVEASELSIGVGIEAGYAYSHKIPIYLISKSGVEVSSSIKGISKKHVVYKTYEELSKLFIC